MNKQEEKFEPLPSEYIDFDKLTYEQFQEQDKLGFLDIAKGIIERDIETRTPPLIYGVYGRWGSGKTFMMRAMQQEFEKRSGYKTVWFDPWLYEHANKEQLFLGLLRKIQRVIYPGGQKIKNIGVKVASSVLALGRLAFDAMVVPTDKFEQYQKNFTRLFAKKQIELVDAVENTHEELKDAVANALKKTDSKSLVLFVDDLDRCLPDRAILLLDQLKNFLCVPCVIAVLGVDKKVFVEMLDDRYGYVKSEENFGDQYLEKIIQKSYSLESLQFVVDLISPFITRCKNLKPYPEAVELAARFLVQVGDFAPRKIGRIARNFAVLSNTNLLASVMNEVIGIKAVHPDRFDVLTTGLKLHSRSYGEATPILRQTLVPIYLWYVLVLIEQGEFNNKTSDISSHGSKIWDQFFEKDRAVSTKLLDYIYTSFKPWF